MNTVDKWLTTATICDHSRRELWSQVFPGAVMPIKSILTCKVDAPGHQNVDAYMLDLDAISDVQREGLIKVIARRFNIPIDEVRSEIKQGVPILAEGVSVSSADQGMVLSLMDDSLHGDEWDLDEDLFHHQEWDED